MEKHKLYSMSFAKIYSCYITKAEKKSRTKAEVDEIISWLTGYSYEEVEKHIRQETTIEDFMNSAKGFNPLSQLIKGSVCGIRVEDIEDPMMKKIRYLDKLIDELAKGKSIDKILRKEHS